MAASNERRHTAGIADEVGGDWSPKGGRVDCRACGRANREGARFCAGCATPLTPACASCGNELEADAQFCDQCGTPVGGEVPTDGPPASGDVAVRKTVTVLFCDLVGSTAFAERVDAESARDAMGDYHSMARSVIEEAGGTVAKFIGDGVMALFGVPETAEDDAHRAVAAGVELQRRFAPIRERIAARHGAELALRVGINTGEVVLAEDDADIVGDALNTAARLEAACAPGEVLVGEGTWRLTRARVSYDVLGEVEVKGKDAPIATFQVVEAGADDEQPTPFVGRLDELARLRTAYEDAVARRALRLVTIVGAPGVGKTRISRELSASLAAGADGTDSATVAILRCERAGTSTFGPIADLLRASIDVDDDAPPDDVRAALRSLVDNLDDADRIAELLAAFVGAAPTRSTEEAFLAVRRLVEAYGRRRPLVVVVDDIQWAEPLFLDLLEHVAEWVQDAAAMIVCLARPELRELRPALTEEGRRVAVAIALEGLDAEATAELAARLVGAESLPTELVARLPESTEGNPLFVREFMRMLVDDGVIERGDDGWQLTIDADAVEVPPTIQALLAARLDRMPEGERRLIELASVVGPEFPLGAVAAIVPFDEAALRRSLDGLRRRELVEATTTYWGDEPVFRFHHVLIRDAAYRRLLKRVRADLHLRVGEWTERTAAGLPGEHEVAIAHHFEQAHEYRRQLADVDGEVEAVGRRAAALLLTAAERALQRDDVASSGALAERALARLDRDDVAVPELLLVACEALLAFGELGRGRTRVEELVAVAEGDPRLSAWADCFVAEVAVLTDPGRLRDAAREVAAAAERLAELGDEAGVAKARLVRAGALARLGRVGECEAELDRALVAARSAGDRRRIAAVLGAAPLAALWGPSPIPRAGGRCLDVIRLLRITTGSPAVESTSVRCQAVLEALRGRFDTARTMLADARATVEELGLRQGVAETELFAGIVELLAGDPVAAEAPLRAAHQVLGRLGIGADAGQAAACLARALLQQGRLDEAEELAADSSALAGQNPQTAIAARSARAEILAARGRHDEAVAVAAEAVELGAGTDIVIDRANAHAVLARVARQAGADGIADRAAAAAAALYEQKAADVKVDALAPGSGGVPAESEPRARSETASTDVDADHREPSNDADRWARELFAAMTARRTEDVRARLDEDCELHEREPGLRTAHIGRDAVMAALSPGLFPTEAMVVADVETIATRGDHLVLHRVAIHASDGADGATLDALHVSRWNAQGRGDYAASYAVDDLDDALAELDRLHGEGRADEHEPRNEADRLARRFVELFTAGAREEWLPMLSPSHVTRDKRPIVGVDTSGIDGVADAYPRDRDTREMSSTVETVAIRGESFALIRWRAASTSGREWDSFHLTRWTAGGLNDLNVIFPPGELHAALVELDELWLADLETGDVETYRTAHAWAEAYGSGDEAALRAVMHDDFVLTDHRVMGFGELDGEQMLELMRSRVGTRGLAVPITSAVHLLGRGMVVGTYHDRSSGRDGAEYVADTVFLCRVRDRRISSASFFDADCVDTALQAAVAVDARSAPGPSGATPAFVHPLQELGARLVAALESGDPESATQECLEPDFVRVDHRSVVALPELDRDAYVRDLAGLGARRARSRRCLAVREFGYVSEMTTEYAGGEQSSYLVVLLSGATGRIGRAVYFDIDRVDDAIAELDESWLATLDTRDAATYRVASSMRDAYTRLDRDRVVQLCHPEFVYASHRPLHFGQLDRDGLLELLETRRTTRGPGSAWTVSVDRLDGGVIVFTGDESTTIDGSAEYSDLSVFVAVVLAGTLMRLEQYPIDRREDALARAREEASASSPGRFENAASRWAERAAAANMDLSPDLFTPSFVREDRRRVVGAPSANREQFLERLGAQRDMGVRWSIRTVAVRGERFGLFEAVADVDGSVVGVLALQEIDDADRLARAVLFDVDQLDEAIGELDRAWRESFDDERRRALEAAWRYGLATMAGDPNALEEATTDDCHVTDHRPLGKGGLSRRLLVDAVTSRPDVMGEERIVAVSVHRLDADVAVLTATLAGRTPAGLEYEESRIQLWRIRDGRVAGIEIFPPHELDAALARARAHSL